MTENTKTGGPAFPRECYGAGDQPGMSLRDYFAAAALAAMTISDERKDDLFLGVQGGMKEAKAAYAIADAMLKARES